MAELDITPAGSGDIPVKATGAEINTGTDDAKFATAKAIADSDIQTGWTSARETWTYASATTVTVAGDLTTKYYKGMKVKLTQTTAKYFVIAIDPTYSDPDTTLTLHPYDSTTSVANAAITLNYYSTAEKPTGFPDKPKARASLSADQLNLVNVTPTTILLDAEQYDVGANFASNIFTAPVSGYYYINGNVTFLAASVIADVSYIGRITKGASTSIAEMWGTPSAVKEFSCVVSTTYYLTKGDTIKLTAYQASGGDTIDVDGHASAVFTYLEVRFLEN